jgi:hypothetical protein
VPRRAEALHLVEADVLGGGRPRRAPGRDARGAGARGALAVGRGRDPGGHLRATRVDERGVFVQHYDTTRSTPRCC